MNAISEQLAALAEQPRSLADKEPVGAAAGLTVLEDAAEAVAKAWSGSSLGYHADVYYARPHSPPPGDHFSSEWGLMESFAPGTSGDWREHDHDEVKAAVREAAGNPDLSMQKPMHNAAPRPSVTGRAASTPWPASG